MATETYVPLTEYFDLNNWPLGSLAADALSGVFIQPPTVDEPKDDVLIGLYLPGDFALRIPGLDFLAVGLGSTTQPTATVRVQLSPLKIILQSEVTLRVDADILRPMKPGTKPGAWEPDLEAKTLDIALGTIDLEINGDGDVNLNLKGATPSIPRCTIGQTGVVLEIGKLQWITPSTPAAELPPAPVVVPTGFTGLFLDDVSLEIPNLEKDAALPIFMDYAFLGTGGFSGKIARPSLELKWKVNTSDPSQSEFTGMGAIKGELFGFKGGLTKLELEFRQSALVGCTIAGDIFIPYLDKRIGLALGLNGAGGLTATAGPPNSVLESPVTDDPTAVSAAPSGYLVRLNVRNFLEVDIDSLLFEVPADGPAALEISGRAALKLSGFDCPPFGVKGLRINTLGQVEIKGGWIDLNQAKPASFYGFSLEISQIGFGSLDDGRRWVSINGGLHLAKGLPMGASVEGLRVVWDPSKTGTDFLNALEVSLKGIGLEVKVPGAFEFVGAVSFFKDQVGAGFRGHVKLGLPSIKLTIDADLVVGRTTSGATFFYLYLGVDLPTGIPLGNTGAAFYGFQGLVATNMAPDKQPDEPWYYGWYLRDPKGATDNRKWKILPGAFAIGLGTTLGTSPDDGFSFSAKALLILVLPGPQIILEGKGSFLKTRPNSKDVLSQGAFEALIVLDVPAKLFQANLAAVYEQPKLLLVRGGADVAFSWAATPPVDLWHVYLGEKQPMSRRWRAEFLSIFEANSYFQLWRDRLELGAWIGVEKDWQFGPVHVWLKAMLEGQAAISRAPEQFDGSLALIGEAGVQAFGASVILNAEAVVEAHGPRPWFVEAHIKASLKIDLWLFHFSWESELPFQWGDRSQPLPQPVLPSVGRVAWEHLKIDESGELAGATLPPDARPVVIFNRPVRDLAGIGAPSSPISTPPDVVGPNTFSYQLGHVVLLRTDGGNRVVAASGVLDAANGAISLPGSPDLPSAAGGKLELLTGQTVDVTGSGSGTLSVSGTVPNGRHAYRLHAPRLQADVQINSVKAAALSTVDITLNAATGAAKNAFSGGRLETGAGKWIVLGNDGAQVIVRTPADEPQASPPTLPATGAAKLVGPPSPRLEGVWLPAADVDPPATKLMLWARTPFAWFRRSDQDTIEGWDLHNADYACGPQAVEEPICLGFDDLSVGPLQRAFTTERLPGTTAGQVDVVFASQVDPNDHAIAIGFWPDGRPGSGSVTFRFEAAIEGVQVRASTREGGVVIVRRQGAEVNRAFVNRDRNEIELSGAFDEVEITGSAVTLSQLCYLPGWTCVGFEPASFPQASTGRQSYAGLWLTSNCTMNATTNGLEISGPCQPLLGGVLSGVAGPIDTRIFLAVLLIELPQPVTRVRLRLTNGPASLAAYAGTEQLMIQGGNAGDEVSLIAPSAGWIDRVLVMSAQPIGLQQICYDAGPFGWKRYEQWAWRKSLQRSIESLYQEDPVLLPGSYRLDIATRFEAKLPTGDPEWTSRSINFTVGPPAGLGTGGGAQYPGGGPLNDLSTYVRSTLPGAGERPFYRAYDLGAAFNVNYITRLFLAAGQPLSVAAVDANDIDRRAGSRNAWERNLKLDQSREEEAWTKTLHGDGTQPCATIDAALIKRNEGVLAGAGELLAPNQLHAGELCAGSRRLFRFEFVTSRFANFVHHLVTFNGQTHLPDPPVTGTGPTDPAGPAANVATARQTLATVGQAFATAEQAINSGNPTRAQFEAYHAAGNALAAAREALRAESEKAFRMAWAAYSLPNTRPLPERVEITRLPGALLIESPEPMHWERLKLTAERSTSLPMRRRTLAFDRSLGAPDMGAFDYAGLEWSTSVELRVVESRVEPRVPGTWTLTLKLPAGTRSIEAVVRLASGGSARLHPVGTGASADAVQGPVSTPATVKLTVSGTSLNSATLSGNGLSLESVAYVEPFRPTPPRGDLRLLRAQLPATGVDHSVDLIAYADVDLAGWSVRWVDALNPATPAVYHTFAGGTLKDARVARIYGGKATGGADPGLDTYFGGTQGTLPSTGAIFQLVNPANQVTHELAVMAGYALVSGISPVPNGDGTRAFLLSTTGPLTAGHWRLSCEFARNAGPGLPILSVGSDKTSEVATLLFTVE